MERQEFVEAEPGSWWFTEPSPDRPWHQARLELGEGSRVDGPVLVQRAGEDRGVVPGTGIPGAAAAQRPRLPDRRLPEDGVGPVGPGRADRSTSRSAPEPPIPTATPPAPVVKDDRPPAPQNPPEAPVAKRPAARLFAKKGADAPPGPPADPIPDAVPAHVIEGVSRVLESLSGENAARVGRRAGANRGGPV